MSYTVLRPYARKFASVYSHEAWTLTLNDALTHYGDSRFFGSTELLGTLQARSPAAFNSTVEIDGSLLAHGRATFESPATFTGSPTGASKNRDHGLHGERLSWLVETDNTGSEFQVQATAAFDPITVGSAVCNVSLKFTSLSTIDDSTVWPSASWSVSASSTKTGSAANNALDKSDATSWTSSSSSYSTSGSGGEFLTVQYPAAVVIKSFTLTNSPDTMFSWSREYTIPTTGSQATNTTSYHLFILTAATLQALPRFAASAAARSHTAHLRNAHLDKYDKTLRTALPGGSTVTDVAVDGSHTEMTGKTAGGVAYLINYPDGRQEIHMTNAIRPGDKDALDSELTAATLSLRLKSL
ncbi:hypothetical protein T492DRAFT_1113721 [Pavlovales sp. CCMP2436]|nr:hypothetical protein T492DRAFT_1113721 [Pavlovales sp. CCMP2436]